MEYDVTEPKRGDIIRVKVSFYHHYGIFEDYDNIIQFGARDNSGVDPEDIRVMVSDAASFSGGGIIETAVLSRADKRRANTPDEVIAAARARIGEGGYDIIHNNCEHFVNECVFGEHRSDFVDMVRNSLKNKLGK